MKNVKMSLSAIAIFAVVGAALAFTPAKGKGGLFCKSSSTGTCSATADYASDPSEGEFDFWCGATSTACQNNTTVQQKVDDIGE